MDEPSPALFFGDGVRECYAAKSGLRFSVAERAGLKRERDKRVRLTCTKGWPSQNWNRTRRIMSSGDPKLWAIAEYRTIALTYYRDYTVT
jgi:hypothetical protein